MCRLKGQAFLVWSRVDNYFAFFPFGRLYSISFCLLDWGTAKTSLEMLITSEDIDDVITHCYTV